MPEPKYSQFICMAGEVDEVGQLLECDPPSCGIDDCPVMMLRKKTQLSSYCTFCRVLLELDEGDARCPTCGARYRLSVSVRPIPEGAEA